MKRILTVCLLVIFGLMMNVQTVLATESVNPVDQVLGQQLDLFDWQSIEELEERLKESAPHMEGFNLSEEVTKLVSGQERFSLEHIVGLVGQMFFSEIGLYIKIIIRFILIVILCSFLQTLSTSFKSQNITKAAFFVCYLLIIYTISQSLFVIVDLAMTTIEQLSEIMLVTLPTLLAFMAVSGYITSSSALAPVMIGVLNLMTFLIQKIILPIIVGVIVLQIVSTMSEEIKLDKFVGLFYKGVKYALRGIFGISLLIMGAYKLTLPYVDVAIKKGAINLSTAFIPVVGDVGSGALEFMLSCASLIKNSFAIGVIIWIIVIASVPLIKIFAYVALYHVAGAVVQPIGDKKMSEIATTLAKGCEFILSCVGIVVILTVVVMIVCASIGMSIT